MQKMVCSHDSVTDVFDKYSQFHNLHLNIGIMFMDSLLVLVNIMDIKSLYT